MKTIIEIFEKPIGILILTLISVALFGGAGFWVLFGYEQGWSASVWFMCATASLTAGSYLYFAVDGWEKKREEMKAAREAELAARMEERAAREAKLTAWEEERAAREAELAAREAELASHPNGNDLLVQVLGQLAEAIAALGRPAGSQSGAETPKQGGKT